MFGFTRASGKKVGTVRGRWAKAVCGLAVTSSALGLSACGGGSPSAASIFQQASAAVGLKCTPTGSPTSLVGYGCGDLHVTMLTGSETEQQWAQQAGAGCYISGSGWVIDGGSANSKVANAVGGSSVGQC